MGKSSFGVTFVSVSNCFFFLFTQGLCFYLGGNFESDLKLGHQSHVLYQSSNTFGMIEDRLISCDFSLEYLYFVTEFDTFLLKSMT